MTATQEATRERYAEAALIPKEPYISRGWLAAEYERLWPRVSNMAIVQAGMHDPSFTGLRLNRQEMGVRNHAKFVQRLVGNAG
jgi:hypothetical protein